MTEHKRNVHFVGVGGIGMSGLAEILLNLGYTVSGTDLRASTITSRLESLGMTFHEGHDAAHIGRAGILVVSAAVRDDNPELCAARAKGIPVLHRSELLADLMRLKPNAVAVGGTHGKTTTTSMVSAILDHADIGATSIVGGILHRSGTNARWGTGDCLVAEADESDGSFLRLHPSISVVTNIDAEHLSYYGTLDNIKRAFTDFCNDVPFYGYSILCRDDANVRSILPDITSVYLTYGLDDAEASVVGTGIQPETGGELNRLCTRMTVVNHDPRLGPTGELGDIHVNALGLHNMRNALAACTVGLCLGMDFDTVSNGLRLYDGVRRRLQVCGEAQGVLVVEDYAHHPTEIAGTLEALRWIKPKRVVAVFQPHLFSRTKHFYQEFATILSTADVALVTDIYPAREDPMPGVDSGLIVDAARKAGADQVELVADMDTIPDTLAADLQEGDVVLILGAGNINRIAAPLLDALRTR